MQICEGSLETCEWCASIATHCIEAAHDDTYRRYSCAEHVEKTARLYFLDRGNEDPIRGHSPNGFKLGLPGISQQAEKVVEVKK